MTCKTTFAKQKTTAISELCRMYLESSAAGCWVSRQCYKYKRRLMCWVGWQSTAWTKCEKPKRIFCMHHTRISTRQRERPPAAARGTTGFSHNLWPFHQHQGDWERAGQTPVPLVFAAVSTSLRSICYFQRSTKKITQECDTNGSSVHLIQQLHKYQLYKIHIAQQWLRHTILCILPSNKACFQLSGTVNRHNAMYWSDKIMPL